LKLDLGCGRHKERGWISVDSDPLVGPDVVADMVEHAMTLPDDSVDVVRAIHSVEHLAEARVERLLEEVHRALRPGGTCIIEMPDLEAAAIVISGNPDGRVATLMAHRLMRDGDHRSAWTFGMLRALAEKCRYRRCEKSRAKHHRPRYDMRVTLTA
jgi:SAM-dependent methyltransferase